MQCKYLVIIKSHHPHISSFSLQRIPTCIFFHIPSLLRQTRRGSCLFQTQTSHSVWRRQKMCEIFSAEVAVLNFVELDPAACIRVGTNSIHTCMSLAEYFVSNFARRDFLDVFWVNFFVSFFCVRLSPSSLCKRKNNVTGFFTLFSHFTVKTKFEITETKTRV